jgi:hypothetical protein
VRLGPDERRLAGGKGEWRATEIEPHESRCRCGWDDFLNGEDESVRRQC